MGNYIEVNDTLQITELQGQVFLKQKSILRYLTRPSMRCNGRSGSSKKFSKKPVAGGTDDEMYSDTRADQATSTGRMSKEASHVVVDENLKVHETDNLFVCSNAVMPNGAAVNPTLTLIALTERLACHVGDSIRPVA